MLWLVTKYWNCALQHHMKTFSFKPLNLREQDKNHDTKYYTKSTRNEKQIHFFCTWQVLTQNVPSPYLYTSFLSTRLWASSPLCPIWDDTFRRTRHSTRSLVLWFTCPITNSIIQEFISSTHTVYGTVTSSWAATNVWVVQEAYRPPGWNRWGIVSGLCHS